MNIYINKEMETMETILNNADRIETVINREYIISELGIIFKMRTENLLIPNYWLQTDNWIDEIVYTLEKVKNK